MNVDTDTDVYLYILVPRTCQRILGVYVCVCVCVFVCVVLLVQSCEDAEDALSLEFISAQKPYN